MKQNFYKSMVLVLFSVFILGAPAFGAPTLYDNFSGQYIDSQKWYYRELVREVAGGKLVSKIGNASGSGMFRNRTPFQNPNSIHTIESEITVVDATLDTGTDPRSFALIEGFFYNTKGSGAATGDIWGAVYIGDRGNGLEAWWTIIEFTNDNQTTYDLIESKTLIDPGILDPNKPYTAKIKYDEGANEFTFRVDTESYTFTTGPPRQRPAVTEFKALSTWIAANGGSAIGYVSALFDNVFVNNNPYDDFSTGALEPTNWQALEFVREISGGKLRLNVQADGSWGTAVFSLKNRNTAYLEAEVTVEGDTLVADGATGEARIGGYYYNDSRGPGSGQDYDGYKGNVYASNAITLDEYGNLKAIANVFRHDDTDPYFDTQLFHEEFPAKISFDTPYILSLEFTGSSLIFKCNGESINYPVTLAAYYEPYDKHRILLSRVFAGPGQSGYIKATFDDVYVGAPGSISGQVTGPNGPIRGLWLEAWAGPCWNTWLGGASTDEDGTYTIENLPSGPVYVRACATCNHFNYVDEWFDDNDGTTDCNEAAPVAVLSDQNSPGTDFSLDRGPKRVEAFVIDVTDGIVNASFGVLPGFRSQLEKATVKLPDTTAYEFDLVNDKVIWNTDCRYFVLWWHDLGPVGPRNYGTYILTLDFSNGSQETAAYTLDNVPVTRVDESSMAVTVNDDGSVNVRWALPTTDDQYYRVKVRDESTNEYYASGYMLNASELYIPAADLRCLELGETYGWLVQALDDIWGAYSTIMTTEITRPYSPSALANRTSMVKASAWNDELILQFDVRPGSRNNIDHVTVTGPNGSYPFDLSADWVDFSTETRLGVKGWGKTFALGPDSYGTYNFEVAFQDGHTENPECTLDAVSVTPVDSATMEAVIYADGAITFSWDLPDGVTGQKYEVRIRSEDGSKEYYGSPVQEDMTTVTASSYDLRAMERGQTYQWFVRASDDYWGTMNTVEQSGSLTFLYDPFPTYNPGSALFGPDSATLTNTYMPMQLGDKLTYAGTGAFAGCGHYWQAVAIEDVDSVSCLKILIRGYGNHPDPDQDPEWGYLWLAQDSDGSVWLLKYEGHKDAEIETYVFGRSGAVLLMPTNPKAGQIFVQVGDDYQQVQATGVTVPQLGTGLGPFTDCLKILQIWGPSADDIQYMAPDIGTVKEERNIKWETKGWELITLPTGLPLVTTGSATSITSASATLNGTVNPKGLTTTYYFEYGTTTGYGSTTPEAGAGSGWDDVPVNGQITISDPLATYHCRVVATNSAGTSYGGDKTFGNDTDADLMPDDWEVTYFGDLSHDGTLDADTDDLTDLQEYQNGTIPTNPDTDDDQMPDGWEVNNGLSPVDDTEDNGRDGDLDNDGWTNYEEYINGTNPADDTSPAVTPPEVREVIPHDNAGIGDSTRVPNNTSFAVRIEDSDGIDITDTSSIKFTIDDGVNVYERDLSYHAVVRVLKLTSDDDTEITKLWTVYDRSKEATYGNYTYDTNINIKVDAQDIRNDWMTQASYDFNIETETEHDDAQANLPETNPADTTGTGYDAGIEVTSGDLEGAKILYDSNEPVPPTFGPTDELPPFDVTSTDAIGVPMNLQPSTVFNTPVKIFIPCPGYTDVSNLTVYLYNGTNWVLACDASGNVQQGGEAWMVPGSRVNNNNGSPSTIEIQVYHFSGVQAASTPPSPGAAPPAPGGGGGGGCFIDTAGSAFRR